MMDGIGQKEGLIDNLFWFDVIIDHLVEFILRNSIELLMINKILW